MATSAVYSSIFAAVMASLPCVDTKLICFDTQIVDLKNSSRIRLTWAADQDIALVRGG